MKIKPLYIYVGLFVAVIAGFIIFSGGNDESGTAQNMSGEMPKDEIHQGMQNGGTPSSSNINEATRKKAEDLKNAYESNPNDTSKARQYAEWLSMAHSPDQAVEIYENILKKGPKRTDVMLELTFLYYNKGELAKAEEYTNNILKIEPGNRFAHYNLGAIAGAKGDEAKAKSIWEDVLKKYPNTEVAGYASESLKQVNEVKK